MKIYLSAALLISALLAANAGQAVITTRPQDLTINAGSTADFTVTATNALTYQWTFQGAGMSQGTNIAGATNSEYQIADASTNQAGVYAVIVGSTGTNVTASAALSAVQGTIVNFQISGFRGGPSNVLVELFDHDKPATVQNFLHYIVSGAHSNTFVSGAYSKRYSTGAYSNMFFDRLIPGFVLQGGGYFAQDRTNSAPLPNVGVGDIYQVYFTDVQVQNPVLPQQVDSEFYVGPKVSNTRGTIAMALPAGNVDGAANDFYFNLVDNTNLDVFVNGGGPYTVFGRVLSGTNVLQYFNNTNQFFKPSFSGTPTNNIFTNGIFDFALLGYSVLTDLPVNFHGTNLPANSNLFFVDFSFPNANAQPVLDTNPPSSAITFPPANIILTNGISLTVTGTAQDDVGLARVYCSLVPLNGAYGGTPGGANATGTTNWSLAFGVIEPGIYNILVTPQDGAGNLGSLIEQTMIITAVLTNGTGAVSATNLSTGTVLGNAVGANLLAGTNYALAAQPGPGWLFLNWTSGTNLISSSPNLAIQMSSSLVVTANFITNNFPVLTQPGIASVTLSGTNLVLNGSNGQSGGTYYVLMSPNVNLPLSQWTPVATNVLSAGGNFTIIATNTVTRTAPQRFYILQEQ